VAFAFLAVMAFATLPSPLYGLYRTHDDLSTLTVTVVYAVFAFGAIATLLCEPVVVARIGRRGAMLGGVSTMMVAAAVIAVWKALPGLLVGRVISGVSVGLAAGTATAYLVELRLRDDPNASVVRARTIGTSVNIGALGVGPLVAGVLAEWTSLALTLPTCSSSGWARSRSWAWWPLRKPVRRTPTRRRRWPLPAVRALQRLRRLRPSRRQGSLPACPGSPGYDL
jgi:MFS family permease